MPKLSSTAKALPPFDLKAAREKHGLTQMQTAVMLFTTQSSIARWETDGDMPQIHREYWALYWKVNKTKKESKGAKSS